MLQPDGGLHPLDGRKREAPVAGGGAYGGDYAFFDHFVDKVSGDAAQSAEIAERATGFLVEDQALQIYSVLAHIRCPMRLAG